MSDMTIWMGKRWTWRLVFFTSHNWPQISKFRIEIHSQIKQRKRKRRNLLEVKEGEEVHEVASEKWEEATAWLICNDKWNYFFKDSQKHQLLLLFLFFFKDLQFLRNIQQSNGYFHFGPVSIYQLKFGICSGIARMTSVWLVFKSERNTSIPIPAKVPVW